MRARIAVLTTLAFAAAVPAMAQQPESRAPRPPAAERRQLLEQGMARMQEGATPEALLRMREELGLTEQQITRLEALRQERVSAQRDRMAERLEWRSQIESGRMTREQLRERVQERMQAGRSTTRSNPRDVLTDPQRQRLTERQMDRMQQRMRVQGMRQMRERLHSRGDRNFGRGGMRPGMRRPMMDRPGMEELRERMRERMESMPDRGQMRMRRPGGPGRGEGLTEPS